MNDVSLKMIDRLLRIRPKMRIDSLDSLEAAALKCGILPFFPNNIKGLSVEEMCVPGMLFGGNFDEGCWEWKGPVIRRHSTAYGKFFRRKAGFVSLELLPDFLNYRRKTYPLSDDSTEQLLLDIIRENDGLTSTELKQYIFGGGETKREWYQLPSIESVADRPGKKKSIESPLQRLQMGGWILISDFVYKRTRNGERYGWGVATYTTPELNFRDSLHIPADKTAEESLKKIIGHMRKSWPSASKEALLKLLK